MKAITPHDVASRFLGVHEIPGSRDNPAILWMLQLGGTWPDHDEIPWCAAFVGAVFWLLGILLPNAHLAARSWLTVGTPILLADAKPGWDIVILSRDGSPTAGHVGFYHGREHANIDGHEIISESDPVILLGGNQHDQVSLAAFPSAHVLGVRRLA